MSDAKDNHDDHDHHASHMKLYWMVFVGLLIGTVLTVAASKIHFGGYMDIVVALFIAICKAFLVLAFFMHLNEAVKLVKLIAVAAFMWLIILLAYLVVDVDSRSWVPVEKGWIATSTDSGSH